MVTKRAKRPARATARPEADGDAPVRLGLRAYARHRGVRLSAVQKAIRDGRIERGKDGKIDRDAADKAWAENTYTGWGGKRTPKKAPARKATPTTEPQPDPEAEEQAKTIRRAQATKEHYLAEKRKLEYELLAGKLVDREQRDHEEFERLRFIRDEVMSIPDRVAAQAATELEVDAGALHALIDTEIRRILDATADALEQTTKVA